MFYYINTLQLAFEVFHFQSAFLVTQCPSVISSLFKEYLVCTQRLVGFEMDYKKLTLDKLFMHTCFRNQIA